MPDMRCRKFERDALACQDSAAGTGHLRENLAAFDALAVAKNSVELGAGIQQGERAPSHLDAGKYAGLLGQEAAGEPALLRDCVVGGDVTVPDVLREGREDHAVDICLLRRAVFRYHALTP